MKTNKLKMYLETVLAECVGKTRDFFFPTEKCV